MKDLVLLICLAAGVDPQGIPQTCKVVRVPIYGYANSGYDGTSVNCAAAVHLLAPSVMRKHHGWFLKKWRCGARLQVH